MAWLPKHSLKLTWLGHDGRLTIAASCTPQDVDSQTKNNTNKDCAAQATAFIVCSLCVRLLIRRQIAQKQKQLIFLYLCIRSFIYVCIYPCVHSYSYSLTDVFIYSSSYSGIYAFVCSWAGYSEWFIHYVFISSLIHSCINGIVYLFIYYFIHVHPFIHSSIRSSVHPIIHPFTHWFFIRSLIYSIICCRCRCWVSYMFLISSFIH